MEITRRKRQEHPGVAVKRSSAGLGLFATATFKKGDRVIEYIGNRLPAHEGDKLRSQYVFRVNSKWDIDGTPRWNTARYANHSCHPTCEAHNVRSRIFIVARRAIKPGEEITYDYGKEFFDSHILPKGCRCVRCGY